MKKLIVSLTFISFNAAICMYDQGGTLKYDKVELTNKSSIPLTLSWIEIRRPEGKQVTLTRGINPGETITVKIGEVGGYYQGEPSKIIYQPIAHNPSFKEYFIIDLPNSKAFAFTAVTLADIFKNIHVPVLFKADDEGNFTSSQHMISISRHGAWENLLRQAAQPTVIKNEEIQE